MTRIDRSNEGRRVELIHTDDPHTNLQPGARGTFEFCLVQETMENQVSIKWDDGSSLMLLQGKDSFRFVEE